VTVGSAVQASFAEEEIEVIETAADPSSQEYVGVVTRIEDDHHVTVRVDTPMWEETLLDVLLPRDTL
jgi:hypothetical protein